METAAQVVIAVAIKVNEARCRFKVENVKFKTLFATVDTVSEIVSHVVSTKPKTILASKSFRNLQLCLEEIDSFLEKRLRRATSDPTQLWFPRQFSWGSHQQDMAEAWIERLNSCLDNLSRFIDICGDGEELYAPPQPSTQPTVPPPALSTSSKSAVKFAVPASCEGDDEVDGNSAYSATSLDALDKAIAADVKDQLCIVGEGVLLQHIDLCIQRKQKWVEGKARMAACERQAAAMRESIIYTAESRATAAAAFARWKKWEQSHEGELDARSSALSALLLDHGLAVGSPSIDWRSVKLMALREAVVARITQAKQRVAAAGRSHADATVSLARAVSAAAIERLMTLQPPVGDDAAFDL
eukprot:Opistho-1_new@60144